MGSRIRFEQRGKALRSREFFARDIDRRRPADRPISAGGLPVCDARRGLVCSIKVERSAPFGAVAAASCRLSSRSPGQSPSPGHAGCRALSASLTSIRPCDVRSSWRRQHLATSADLWLARRIGAQRKGEHGPQPGAIVLQPQRTAMQPRDRRRERQAEPEARPAPSRFPAGRSGPGPCPGPPREYRARDRPP